MAGEIVVCPVCQGDLEAGKCTGRCGRTYPVRDGIADLAPDPPPDAEVRRKWGLWEELQANGERAYEFDPPSSLSVGERDDATAYARFSELEGRVLDVGCGPQAMPSYAEGVDAEVWGIDPLTGVQPRGFNFVKGVAEYLPFRDGAFDRVLFATSIDHLLSPAMSVASAARVTKPGGLVTVWLGETTPPPTRRDGFREALRVGREGNLRLAAQTVRETLRPGTRTAEVETGAGTLELDVPRGAIDAFHFSHPDRAAVTKWLTDVGLVVEAADESVAGSWFVRARKP